jgi:hypothetical protein
MRLTIESFVNALAVSALFMLDAVSACDAAQLYVGHITCTQQLDNCIDYRRQYGPFGLEGLCTVAFHRCMKTGVWDGRTVFPYGGARMTGMIRR